MNCHSGLAMITACTINTVLVITIVAIIIIIIIIITTIGLIVVVVVVIIIIRSLLVMKSYSHATLPMNYSNQIS